LFQVTKNLNIRLQYLYIVDSYFRTAIGVTPEGL
jgi:hypothetical protein